LHTHQEKHAHVGHSVGGGGHTTTHAPLPTNHTTPTQQVTAATADTNRMEQCSCVVRLQAGACVLAGFPLSVGGAELVCRCCVGGTRQVRCSTAHTPFHCSRTSITTRISPRETPTKTLNGREWTAKRRGGGRHTLWRCHGERAIRWLLLLWSERRAREATRVKFLTTWTEATQTRGCGGTQRQESGGAEAAMCACVANLDNPSRERCHRVHDAVRTRPQQSTRAPKQASETTNLGNLWLKLFPKHDCTCELVSRKEAPRFACETPRGSLATLIPSTQLERVLRTSVPRG
jgi:hypothetical protein